MLVLLPRRFASGRTVAALGERGQTRSKGARMDARLSTGYGPRLQSDPRRAPFSRRAGRAEPDRLERSRLARRATASSSKPTIASS